jgi:protein O-GlcNAc transferase
VKPSNPNPNTRAGLAQRLAAAVGSHQRGDLAAAEAMYGDILRETPRCFDALHLLGALKTDQGAAEAGIELIQRALALDPSQSAAHYSLARAFLARGDRRSALACLERATRLRPDFVDAWFLRGNALLQAGRVEESAESYQRAIELRPGFAEALSNLAVALRALRQTAPALECAERALALDPTYAKALNNRGLILLDAHRQPAAVESFRRAVALNSNFAEALHNLAAALMRLRRFDEARDAFAQLAVVAPDFRHVQGNLLHARLNCCDWSGYEAAVDTVTQAVERGEHADVPTSFLCASGSASLQLRCAQAYTDAHFPAHVPPPHKILRADGRIRVAYLSGDFGEHALTYLLAGVLERHDPARFETIALSWDRRAEGPTRRRVEAAFSRFIDITEVSDAEVVRIMRELNVHIAVDLTGHTLGQRTDIFARRAAPVQVNYLGFPATMGARYIDYLIADQFVVPEQQRIHYAEQVIRLPCFQPNDDRRDLAADRLPRAHHGLPDGGFVFCSFNSNPKLNPVCFDIWVRLLRAVPGSVLWLLAANPLSEVNLRREAAVRGIDASRLVFAKQLPYRDYLARYAHADLFLDCLPFNGGTTASDALSMGVPVLTCVGESFAARMAGSLVSNLGLSELATRSWAEYESTARELATRPIRLESVRQRLRQARSDHPFFDTDCYRRHLEAAYQIMWERAAAGLPPAAFSVEPMTAAGSG